MDTEHQPSAREISRTFLKSAERLFYTQDEMKQIYTDWANHYLERSRSKRLIADLQKDVADGVLLAEIIEAVTDHRVKDIKTKPKNDAQMLDNINLCLKCIEALGINVEGLRAEDIREGNLRTILGLFFSLSRYKQQKKSGVLPPTTGGPSRSSVISSCSVYSESMLSKLPAPLKSSQTNRNSTGTMLQPQQANPLALSNLAKMNQGRQSTVSSGIPAPRSTQPPSTSVPYAPQQSFLIPPAGKALPSIDKENRQSRASVTSSVVSVTSTISSTSRQSAAPVQTSGLPPLGGLSTSTTTPSASNAMGKNSGFSIGGLFHKSKQEKPVKGLAPPKSGLKDATRNDSTSSGVSSSSSECSSAPSSKPVQGIPATSRDPVTTNHFCQPDAYREQPTESHYSITSSPKLALKNFAKKMSGRGNTTNDGAKLLRIEPIGSELSSSSNGMKAPVTQSSDTTKQMGREDIVSATDDFKQMSQPRPEITSALPKPSSKLPSSGLPKPGGVPSTVTLSGRTNIPTKQPAAKSSKTERRLSFTPSEAGPRTPLSSSSISSDRTSTSASSNTSTNNNDRVELCLKKNENTDKPTTDDLTSANKSAINVEAFVPVADGEKAIAITDSIDLEPSSSSSTVNVPAGDQSVDGSCGESNLESALNGAITAASIPGELVDEQEDNSSANSTAIAPDLVEESSVEVVANLENTSDVDQLIEKPVSISMQPTAGPEKAPLSTASSAMIRSYCDGYTSGSRNIGNGKKESGYLSDGEVLRTQPVTMRLFDDDCFNGYISDGNSRANLSRRSLKNPERMPVVHESLKGRNTESSNGSYDRVALEENRPTQNGTSESNFERGSFSYSSLNRAPKINDADRQGTEFLSSSLMRPNQSFSSANNSPRRSRPAPISPPPRDPETVLSNLTDGQQNQKADNSFLYASASRKSRPTIDDLFPSSTMHSDKSAHDFLSDRRSSKTSKMSGGTQTSALEVNGASNKEMTNGFVNGTNVNGYSTNSLNRNRLMTNGSQSGEMQMTHNPPRSRSVVSNHSELSFFSSSSEKPPLPRLSIPNHNPETNGLNGYPNTPQIHSALPPKSIRQSRVNSLQNGHGENIYERLTECERSPRSSGGYSSLYFGARKEGLAVQHERNFMLKAENRTYGLESNYDDVDSSSTVSYPTNGLRSSTPASLTYSLPRNGYSNGKTNPGLSPYVGSLLAKIHTRDDEAHGSAGSLASTASSLYSSPEERHAHEVRKLRRELEQAQERVTSLTNQLSTNTHVVAAFENSLNNMTYRLEMLTSNAQRKDGELLELRRTIETLRREGAQKGLISADSGRGSVSNGSMFSPGLSRRHTFNSTKDGIQDPKEIPATGLTRQPSTESVASLASVASNGSEHDEDGKKKNKKKSWIRSSFNKAFRVGRNKQKNESVSDVEGSRKAELTASVPNSPLLLTRNSSRMSLQSNDKGHDRKRSSSMKPAGSFTGLDRMEEKDETSLIEDLQRQLREKEMTLNDFRLEALNSAQQLDHFKEAMASMRQEIETLRQDNLRLQRLVALKRRSVSSERKSPRDGGARSTPTESGIGDDESPTFDARRIPVKVLIHEAEEEAQNGHKPEELLIGSVKLSPSMQWSQLDKSIRSIFQEYLDRVDVMVNMGLSPDSIDRYYVGTACRRKDGQTDVDSLPMDYLKNDVDRIRVVLKGSQDQAADTIAFETLLPKSVFVRYITLISQHKRVLICGPSGTGKSLLARKIAQHLVLRTGKTINETSVATFRVDQNSSKDLRQFLLNIAERCENENDMTAPTVVILDDLHHVGLLGELFNGFLSFRNSRCPYTIGTMNPTSGGSMSTQQLSHNFKWILLNNQTEPLQHFLARNLRRKMFEHEQAIGVCDSALTQIVEWIPKAWQEVNSFLEKRSSSSVTVGPRLFMDCPMNVRESQSWFSSLWNFSLVPYILEALRETLQLYGRTYQEWEDPTSRLLESYPWPPVSVGEDPENFTLTRIRPEDVGFHSFPLRSPGKDVQMSGDESDTDPLSNMLNKLQEVTRSSHCRFEEVPSS